MTRARTPPSERIAWLVGSTLERAGIRAVLTGGACAGIHSRGRYTSLDVDFILPAATEQSALDEAMKGVGFRRIRDGYLHRGSEIPVEFPLGPLAIGSDIKIAPILLKRGPRRLRLLSPTDSCRDRLAAFYHWNDRQSLTVAVEIALANRVLMTRIREWSTVERAGDRFEEFRAAVLSRRATRRARA